MGEKELDAIIASAALQVPPTYRLESYVINTGNTISASAQMKLTKNGQTLSGVSLGDGSVDAAFLAIESILGRHYELDDFQIQAVTEGREAMGESVVKLRSGGKLYSGRGISTDIIGRRPCTRISTPSTRSSTKKRRTPEEEAAHECIVFHTRLAADPLGAAGADGRDHALRRRRAL